jgi:hypothetical protein
MRNERLFVAVSLMLGAFAFAVVLAYHHVVDGDLWARLAVGAYVWKTGTVMRHDPFAFTPTLPQWIDHEWGAGVVFFALLNWFGPMSLMIFKIVAALGALAVCIAASRANGTNWASLLVLAVPSALAVLPGYVPVVRSHVLHVRLLRGNAVVAGVDAGRTAVAVVRHCCADARVGERRTAGFVVGLAAIAVYAAWLRTRVALATLLAALASHLCQSVWIGLLDVSRARLAASARRYCGMGTNAGVGDRSVLWFSAVVRIVLGADRTGDGNAAQWVGLTMLALTAAAGWLHRRHAPFFGLAALVYVGPYLNCHGCGSRLSRQRTW